LEAQQQAQAALVSARTASWSSKALKALGTSVLLGLGHMHDVFAFYSFLNKNYSLVLSKKFRFLSERGTEGTSSNNKQIPPCMEGD
jgi:hypothetical protein